MKFDKVIFPNNEITELDSYDKFYTLAKNLALYSKINLYIFGNPSTKIYKPIIDAEINFWNNIKETQELPYSDLQGKILYRNRITQSFNKIYNIDLKDQDVLLIPGSSIGIQACHYLINKIYKNKKIVTTSFYYPDHISSQENMIFVDVNNFKSLTAEALYESLKIYDEKTIGGLRFDRRLNLNVGAFIFSDPNNPLSNVVGLDEWKKIIEIFEKYPEIPIIIDEAYSELVYDKEHESILKIATKNILDRLIILRTGSKAFAAAGERMGCLITKNQKFMMAILSYNFQNLIHTSISSQNAYSIAIESFNEYNKKEIIDFYKNYFIRIKDILEKTNFNIKNKNYNPCSAFYIIADFSEFIGKDIDEESKKIYLNKTKIENNIDVAIYILFKYKIGLMPLCFYGANFYSGLLRITYSFNNLEEYKILENSLIKMREDLCKKQDVVCV